MTTDKTNVQEGPVGLSRFIEMIEARASIRKSGMIDGINLLRDLKAMLAAAPQQPSTHWSHDNPGLADQYRAEAMAARRSVGFKQDADDVAPADIAAAIESLQTEYRILESELDTVKKVAYGNVDLLDECEKLRRDAERYRWLRFQVGVQLTGSQIHPASPYLIVSPPARESVAESTDFAIDAAMERNK